MSVTKNEEMKLKLQPLEKESHSITHELELEMISPEFEVIEESGDKSIESKPITLVKFKGTALSAGTWKGIDGHQVEYSKDVLKGYWQSILGATIKSSHKDDQDEVIGWIHQASYCPRDGKINVQGYVFNPRCVEYLSLNPTKVGMSVEMAVHAELEEATKLYRARTLDINRVSLVGRPACRTCYVDGSSIKPVKATLQQGDLIDAEREFLAALELLFVKYRFAGFKNFNECKEKNQDKENPAAYCAEIMRKTEGKGESEKTIKTKNQEEDIDMNEEELLKLIQEAQKPILEKLQAQEKAFEEQKKEYEMKLSEIEERRNKEKAEEKATYLADLETELKEFKPEWTEYPKYVQDSFDAKMAYLKEAIEEAQTYAPVKAAREEIKALSNTEDRLKVAMEFCGVNNSSDDVLLASLGLKKP